MREVETIPDERRASLQAVLQSDLFERSQNLQRLLTYLCEKTIAGESSELKEYTIAVEALGRSESFDQKKDSIVRVEVHRLRKRLHQFYEGPGRGSTLQIEIPEGKYIPQFIRTAPPTSAVGRVPLPAVLVEPSAGTGRIWTAVGVVAIVAALTGAVMWQRSGDPVEDRPAALMADARLPAGAPSEVRILAGRDKSYIDMLGNVWQADAHFSGGWQNTTAHPPIRNAQDQELFKGQREGEFQYDIPLDPGHYELRLYFAETLFGEGNPAGGGESTRLFDVYANGRQLESLLDVLTDAPGPRVADIKVYKDIQPAEDGRLHLEFKAAKHHDPFVNAIEIRRAPPGRIRPIRIAAQATPVRDSEGRPWMPDLMAEGGNLVPRHHAVQGTVLPELYKGERFGNFRYAIPVAAEGDYKLTLYFQEAWFGPSNNGSGGDGSRLFNVYLNHQVLLKNLDIFRAAGGERKAYVKSFHGLRANPRGKLVIEFEPQVNYACISAMEIEDESPVAAPGRAERRR